MASAVEICNRTLIRLGEETITSLTDDSDRARICNNIYPEVLDSLVSEYPWNFAIQRATLARLLDTPVWDFAYAYQLPTDPYCLRVLETDEDDTITYPWRREGDTIVTDATSVNIKYLGRIVDPNKIPPLVRELIAIRLAAEIAYPITGDARLSPSLWDLYKQKEREAKLVNGQEGTPRRIESDELITVRY
jgi:hypothetical protein